MGGKLISPKLKRERADDRREMEVGVHGFQKTADEVTVNRVFITAVIESSRDRKTIILGDGYGNHLLLSILVSFFRRLFSCFHNLKLAAHGVAARDQTGGASHLPLLRRYRF